MLDRRVATRYDFNSSAEIIITKRNKSSKEEILIFPPNGGQLIL